ncbi:Uncharacterized conserved protein YbbK, DUF523 family [Anaerovirgula multivorans]|uniref:Uncharacterized conserved protein YbbK, DUF523 family n=1 Tax=Anaerovirgula multivorans TaxID=312168 RepID=A0A239KH44_9FIRM|nr:DUF523 domain-containing protein [Anaerovirgula multivorans]SNT16939.1 Uncharacterized conserved protein YbbK, DUF523 family [Anaerovirgula multivorans]
MILVSACLLGVNCKYSGKNNENLEVIQLIKKKGGIPVCPEQLGGLTTPRLPAEIKGGEGMDVLCDSAKVIQKDGVEVTEAFVKGAKETLKIAEDFEVNQAILKARSPSCGMGQIYDGSFSGVSIKGDGVTAALLKSKNITVYTEENIAKILQSIDI